MLYSPYGTDVIDPREEGNWNLIAHHFFAESIRFIMFYQIMSSWYKAPGL